MFKVNDIVIYRRMVCRIVGKHRSDFTREMCYILVPYNSDEGSTRMQVPVSNKAGHLRALISRDEIEELIEATARIDTLENKPANMKSQYANLLKTDDIHDLIAIIKTSYSRNQARIENHKKTASVDDEYLKIAENYLFNELAVALDMSYDAAREYFNMRVEQVAKE